MDALLLNVLIGLTGCAAGYAFRGALRRDIAKVVAAAKSDATKVASAIDAEATKAKAEAVANAEKALAGLKAKL